MCWGWVQVWLATLATAPAEDEIRRFWNAKENNVLDAVNDVDRIWVGESMLDEYGLDENLEPALRSAAVRVYDLLFLVGTIDGYQAPVITDELSSRIVEAFDAGGGDLPTASRPMLIEFLRAQRGRFVVPDSHYQEPG